MVGQPRGKTRGMKNGSKVKDIWVIKTDWTRWLAGVLKFPANEEVLKIIYCFPLNFIWVIIVLILRLALPNHKIHIWLWKTEKTFSPLVIYWKPNKHEVCCCIYICQLNPTHTSFPLWRFWIYHDFPLVVPTGLSSTKWLLHSETLTHYLILDHILLSNYFLLTTLGCSTILS